VTGCRVCNEESSIQEGYRRLPLRMVLLVLDTSSLSCCRERLARGWLTDPLFLLLLRSLVAVTTGDIDTSLVVMKFANGVIGTISNSRKATYGYDQASKSR
jgi:hypothetical protein